MWVKCPTLTQWERSQVGACARKKLPFLRTTCPVAQCIRFGYRLLSALFTRSSGLWRMHIFASTSARVRMSSRGEFCTLWGFPRGYWLVVRKQIKGVVTVTPRGKRMRTVCGAGESRSTWCLKLCLKNRENQPISSHVVPPGFRGACYHRKSPCPTFPPLYIVCIGEAPTSCNLAWYRRPPGAQGWLKFTFGIWDIGWEDVGFDIYKNKRSSESPRCLFDS